MFNIACILVLTVLETFAVGHVHRRREPNVKDRREVVFMLMARNP
jgi:hypothetical protein